MQPTQHEVAVKAGVARATVGYVLSGRRNGGKISEAVCERVRQAAAELGYVANRRAQALVSGKTRTVGIVTGDTGDDGWLWSRIVQGAQVALSKAGYDTLFHAVADSQAIAAKAQAFVDESRVDAVIAVPQNSVQADHTRSDLPVVWLDLGISVPTPSVTHDARGGLAQAVRYLHDFGHHSLCWVTPQVIEPRPEHDRTAAVLTTAAALGLQVHVVRLPVLDRVLTRYLVNDQPAGLTMVDQAIAAAPPTTAVLCWNDCLAYAVCAVLQGRGRRVAHDVSVIGFDDSRPMYHVPQLSSVSGAFAEMGAAAADMALELCAGKPLAHQCVAVPTHLVTRRSCAPAPLA